MTAPRSDQKRSLSVHERSSRRAFVVGISLIGLFGGTIGLWAATAPIAGAVLAPGTFVVESNVKKVQHATGGVVGELRVREGDLVQEGDVLIRLDETITRANLQIIVKQLEEMAVRAARLEAEREGAAQVIFPPDLLARMSEPDIQRLIETEAKLFTVRRTARLGQKDQLKKRIAQSRNEIEGLQAQFASREKQSVIIAGELKGVRGLYQQNLVQLTRLNALEREAVNLEGQRGQILAAMSQAESRIAETEIQALQIDNDLRAEVTRELREIQSKSVELSERRVAAEDQLRRVDIRAPASGYVHQMTVHTVGGVITPAEPAMLIVPKHDGLALEARVQPTDIDQIAVGQATGIRIHAFNQRTTPELNGTVDRISPDITREPQTGQVYYSIRVALLPGELERLKGLKLVAGMQSEVFVKTDDRTPFTYLLKPLQDQMSRAFRER
jgi:HlyD family secretion protein